MLVSTLKVLLVLSSMLRISDCSVKFLSVPTVTLNKLQKSANIKVTGCSYELNVGNISSSFASYVYYSKDGKQIGKVNASVTSTDSLLFGTIDDYVVDEYRYFGFFYACEISHPNILGSPFISNKSIEFVDTFLPTLISSNYQPPGQIFTGDDVTLPRCAFKATLTKNLNITYLKDDRFFQQLTISWSTYDQRGFFNVFSNPLLLKNVTRDMGGHYRCSIDYLGAYWSPSISNDVIDVKVDLRNITFQSLPQLKQNIENGYIEVIGCQYTVASFSIPNNAIFEWIYNGYAIPVAITTDTKNGEVLPIPQLPQFPPFFIRMYNQIGTYACRIRIGSESKTSESIVVDKLPAPRFVKQPIPSYNGKVGSSRLMIKGCTINSTLSLIDSLLIFWYKNGFKSQLAYFVIPIPPPALQASDIGITGSFHSFESIVFDKSSLEHQGFYQCAIVLPGGRLILSEKAFVTFSDVSWTRSEVTLNRTYLADHSNRVSSIYKKLENEVKKKFESVLSTNDRKAVVSVDGFRAGSVIVSTSILYGNMTSSEKISVCKSIQQMENNIKSIKDLGITRVTMESQDCCPFNTIGELSFKGVYSFPFSLVNANVSLPCIYDTSKNASRACILTNRGGLWSDPDLSNCPARSATTNNLIRLNQKKICTSTISTNCETPLAISSQLADIVNSTDVVTTHQDIKFIASIVHNIVNINQLTPNENTTLEELKNITNNIFDCLNNVITSKDTQSLAQSQIQDQSSTSILNSINAIAARVGDQIRQGNQSGNIFTITKSNISMSVDLHPPTDVTVAAILESKNQTGIRIDFKDGQKYKVTNCLAKMKIPSEVFRQTTQVIYSVFYTTNDLFQTAEEMLNTVNGNGTVKRFVNSNVMKIAVGNTTVRDLVNPILLTFTQRDMKLNGKLNCEFWNSSLSSGIPEVFGKWSGNGCYLDAAETKGNKVSCKCYHMTNFAILLDITQSNYNPLALEIVTWIGCSISLVGLFLTLLTHLIFKDMRKKLPQKILICLCISLMTLLIIFLAGAEQTSSRIGCQIVAALLQYFMLATFCWMSVEGLNLYRNFVTIFNKLGSSRFVLKASVFAWGLPLVVVIITASANPDNLGNNDFCVVVGYSFYFGVLLPVTAVLLGNVLVLLLVMRSLHLSERNSLNKSQRTDIKRTARIAFSANVLLGTTWIFGLLSVGYLGIIFQWLFTILNGLQGFFIFIFYTVRNQDARKKWLKLFPHIGQHIHESSVQKSSDTPTHSLRMSVL